LLADPTISDILVNGARQVYVERRGQLALTDISFADDDHLMKIIDKIVSRVGRRVDESSPMADARLPDGSRVNVIIPPLALDGPVMSIRRFSVVPLTMDNLIEYKSFTAEMGQVLQALAAAEVNLLISGGTGSGKTTLLNIMSGFIDHGERIVTIEDAAELQLRQPHVVRLETRPPNIEGRGEVAPRALVRNALRMRPDRIILGETRGAEAIDMLQAMNTGHEGSMTTIHANTARDALGRLENMLAMSGTNLPSKVARAQIASAVGVIVQANRLTDGKRKVTSISEITGMEGDVITMQDIFTYRQTGVDGEGNVKGYFQASGRASALHRADEGARHHPARVAVRPVAAHGVSDGHHVPAVRAGCCSWPWYWRSKGPTCSGPPAEARRRSAWRHGCAAWRVRRWKRCRRSHGKASTAAGRGSTKCCCRSCRGATVSSATSRRPVPGAARASCWSTAPGWLRPGPRSRSC
jgi:pilus assembly protein CpaF